MLPHVTLVPMPGLEGASPKPPGLPSLRSVQPRPPDTSKQECQSSSKGICQQRTETGWQPPHRFATKSTIASDFALAGRVESSFSEFPDEVLKS